MNYYLQIFMNNIIFLNKLNQTKELRYFEYEIEAKKPAEGYDVQ